MFDYDTTTTASLMHGPFLAADADDTNRPPPRERRELLLEAPVRPPTANRRRQKQPAHCGRPRWPRVLDETGFGFQNPGQVLHPAGL